MCLIRSLLTFLLLLGCCAPSNGKGGKLLFLMIDGLKWDYITEEHEGFRIMQDQGVKADYSEPQFPSVTVTNWGTILTGVRPEGHGLLNNYIWDVRFREFMTSENLGRLPWIQAYPIFFTAAKQNVSMDFYYWLQCLPAPSGPMRYCKHRPQNDIGIDFKNFTLSTFEAVQSLRNGTTDFAALYYERVDAMGHFYGPDSAEVKEEVDKVDGLLYSLIHHLEDVAGRDGENIVNVMVVSDHGMVAISPDRSLDVAAYVQETDIDIALVSPPVTFLWPKNGSLAQVHSDLRLIPHVTVYTPDQIPARWAFNKHYRVPPLMLVADEGWTMYHHSDRLNFSSPEGYPLHRDGRYVYDSGQPLLGYHGYDVAYHSMRAAFYAYGPYFKRGYVQPGFPNQDIYIIMCNILGIEPEKNDAVWDRVKGMMAGDETSGGPTASTPTSSPRSPTPSSPTNGNSRTCMDQQQLFILLIFVRTIYELLLKTS